MDPGELEYLEKNYQVRELSSDKWVPAIIAALSHGPKHYTEILRVIQPVDPSGGWDPDPPVLQSKVLSQTLHRMVEDELLIKRTAEGVFPPSVTYELSPPAQELAALGGGTIAWANRHADLLERAGQRRRQKRRHICE